MARRTSPEVYSESNRASTGAIFIRASLISEAVVVSRSSPGSFLVLGLVGLGVAAAAIGIWFQWQQTRRCLNFYGVETAGQISRAPRVELWRLKPRAASGHTGRLAAVQRLDITTAKGLVHLRRGLVEDANFDWGESANSQKPLPDAAWDVAFVFADAAGEKGSLLAIDLGSESESAQLTVLGRPGRVVLGKMAKGLRDWVKSTTHDGGRQQESSPTP